MLSGTMYPKKTYGKSLFIGEFKHAVTPTSDVHDQSSSTPMPKKEVKIEPQPEETETNEKTDQVNVSRTLTYDVQGEEQKPKGDEVKLVWKNPAGQPGAAKPIKGLASKAFFTPTMKEGQANVVEQVVDLPVIKEEATAETELKDKSVKKKRLSITSINVTTRKQLLQRPQKISKTKPNTKDNQSQIIVSKTDATTQNTTTNEQHQLQEKAENIKEEGNEDDRSGEESESERTNKSSVEADLHSEFSTQDYSSPDPKLIIIKPVDFAGYAEKTREDVETETSKQLEPNDVADIKRDLAEKGIIALPPDLPTHHHKQKSEKPKLKDNEMLDNDRVQNPIEDSSFQDEEYKDSYVESEDEHSDIDGAVEQASDPSGEKLDQKEGFKTNKSFEIRRLQAKAEREKEKKKRAVFGTRFSKLKARNDHSMLPHFPEHSARVPLKSALKPATPPGIEDPSTSSLKEPSPRRSKSRSSVRIREPEYDYQEYTDVELETDSGDSIRPNTSLSFSDFSIHSDISSDSSSLGTNAGDEAFRNLPYSDEENTSLEGSDIHQLYDELDNISPSRVGYYGGMRDGKSRDSRRERIESSTSRVTLRSSLHLMSPSPQHAHQAAHMRPYHEKPMHLFDAMRHDRYLHSSEGKRVKFNIPEEDVAHFSDGSKKIESVLTVENERNNNLAQGGTKTSPIITPLDPSLHPVNGDARTTHSHKKWKERVAKFFETSYANRDLPKKSKSTAAGKKSEQNRSSSNSDPFKWSSKWLQCSKMSFIRHVLCVAIPTIIITVGLMMVILVSTDALLLR